MTYFTQAAAKSGGFRKISLLAALIEANRAYRERQHLLSLTDEMLTDVGLKRTDLGKS